MALLAGSSDICDHEGCFGLYNLNLVLFNKAWFIVKKKKTKNKKLYIYIMGDLVTCPRYLYATFRKKKSLNSFRSWRKRLLLRQPIKACHDIVWLILGIHLSLLSQIHTSSSSSSSSSSLDFLFLRSLC